MDQGRSTKRYATNQQLLVSCDSWGEFVALYATDVSQGGMFISTAMAPPVLSEVDVQLRLPEGHEIRLRGRVVHTIDAEAALQAQREPGVGIEFVQLDAAMRAQIHQLIEFARWQGTSQRPTATLASHMFEMSDSTSSGVLLSGLPAAPETEGGGETSRSGVRHASSMPKKNLDAMASVSKPPSLTPKKRPATSLAPRGKSENPTTVSLPAAPPAAPPPKPTDLVELKVGITHVARKRFVEAIKHWNEMLKANPGDLEVTKWLHVTEARKAIAAGNLVAAKTSYERALTIDEANMEALKFVREADQRKKLEALPFGRYFVKKKP